jgi:hypothetical protein
MSVCDCEEGKRLLKAAAQPDSESVVREAFLEHIKNCPVCSAGVEHRTVLTPRKL